MIKLPDMIRTSIQNKVFLSFLIILLLLLAVIATSFIVISSLGKASDNILKMNYHSVIATMRMMDALDMIQREYILSQTETSQLGLGRMQKAQHSFSQWMGRAADNVTEIGEQSLVTAIDSLYNRCIISIQSAGVLKPDDLGRIDQIDQQIAMIKDQCLKLQRLNQDAMFKKSKAAQRIARSGTFSLFLMTALVLVLGILLSWGLSKRIVRPILTLKEATQRLARGDYGITLEAGGEDELGILTSKFAAMAVKLKEFHDLNISQTMAEQQKSDAILANIREGILFVGADYTVRDANQAVLEVIGLSRADVIGHHFLEIIKQDRLFADLKSCLESQKSIVYEASDNLLSIVKDKQQLYLEYFFSPVLSSRKDLLGALFLLRDITKLKELDRLKSEFVMIVSHELKSPLTSINMSIDLLTESLGSSAKAEDLELLSIAKEEINRLRRLISDLLDLSKIEAGKLEFRFASAAPEELLESVGQYFKNQLAEKNAELHISCPASIPRIWCDEEKLMLVFSNLIANALKAIGEQGRVILRAEISGDYVQFGVIDNGVGIPLSYHNRIFDRFVQVEDHKAAKGTGLGLTISREIVRAHGGSIWVESIPDQGAAFYFTIPTEPHSLI